MAMSAAKKLVVVPSAELEKLRATAAVSFIGDSEEVRDLRAKLEEEKLRRKEVKRKMRDAKHIVKETMDVMEMEKARADRLEKTLADTKKRVKELKTSLLESETARSALSRVNSVQVELLEKERGERKKEKEYHEEYRVATERIDEQRRATISDLQTRMAAMDAEGSKKEEKADTESSEVAELKEKVSELKSCLKVAENREFLLKAELLETKDVAASEKKLNELRVKEMDQLREKVDNFRVSFREFAKRETKLKEDLRVSVGQVFEFSKKITELEKRLGEKEAELKRVNEYSADKAAQLGAMCRLVEAKEAELEATRNVSSGETRFPGAEQREMEKLRVDPNPDPYGYFELAKKNSNLEMKVMSLEEEMLSLRMIAVEADSSESKLRERLAMYRSEAKTACEDVEKQVDMARRLLSSMGNEPTARLRDLAHRKLKERLDEISKVCKEVLKTPPVAAMDLDAEDESDGPPPRKVQATTTSFSDARRMPGSAGGAAAVASSSSSSQERLRVPYVAITPEGRWTARI